MREELKFKGTDFKFVTGFLDYTNRNKKPFEDAWEYINYDLKERFLSGYNIALVVGIGIGLEALLK